MLVVFVFHHPTPTTTPKERTQFYERSQERRRNYQKHARKIAELNDKDDTCVVETWRGRLKWSAVQFL